MILVILLVMLTALLYVLAFWPDTRKVTEKTVWTYWHGLIPPEIVRRCHQNWQSIGKVKDVRFLNALNVHKYVPVHELKRFNRLAKCEAHKSDLIRFYVLRKYGGVWIDSSVFFTEPLDWLPSGKFFCFQADRFSKDGLVCLENFFIQSPVPEHPFLVKWFEQTLKDFEDPNYKEVNKHYRDIIGQNGDYLIPYVSSMKISKGADIVTESAEKGPYLDTVRHGWDNPKKVCEKMSYEGRLVKLWNGTRRACHPEVVPVADTTKDHSPTGVYNRFKSRFTLMQGDSGPVDMAYCICMPSRKEYAKGKMAELGVRYKFFDAIKPDDLDMDDYRRLSQTYHPLNRMLFRQMTKLPVALSFFMVYWDAYVNGYETIMVLEDDIIFEVSRASIFEAVEEFKRVDCEVLFLGYCWASCDRSNFTQISENLHKTNTNAQLLCNHALVMKKSFLKKYMERDRPTYWTTRNDHTLSDFLKGNNISRCVTTKGYVSQNRKELGSNNNNHDLGGRSCNLEK